MLFFIIKYGYFVFSVFLDSFNMWVLKEFFRETESNRRIAWKVYKVFIYLNIFLKNKFSKVLYKLLIGVIVRCVCSNKVEYLLEENYLIFVVNYYVSFFVNFFFLVFDW